MNFCLYMVLALHKVAGVQLRDASKSISVRRAIMEAVDTFHCKNMTHGDLSPENILVEEYDQVKVGFLASAM